MLRARKCLRRAGFAALPGVHAGQSHPVASIGQQVALTSGTSRPRIQLRGIDRDDKPEDRRLPYFGDGCRYGWCARGRAGSGWCAAAASADPEGLVQGLRQAAGRRHLQRPEHPDRQHRPGRDRRQSARTQGQGEPQGVPGHRADRPPGASGHRPAGRRRQGAEARIRALLPGPLHRRGAALRRSSSPPSRRVPS